MSHIYDLLQNRAAPSAAKVAPSQQQVITWAREAEYPMECGAFGGGILIGPHFMSHLERLASLAFEAGRAAERERVVALCLSPIGKKLAGLSNGADQLAVAIETGDFQ